jgi:hypothetical protein
MEGENKQHGGMVNCIYKVIFQNAYHFESLFTKMHNSDPVWISMVEVYM